MIALLIIIYISFISLGLPDSLLGSAWPSLHESLGVPLSFAGIPAFICSAGTVTSSFFSAKLIQKFGTGLISAVSVCMTAAALIGISFSPGFLWICLFTIPLGLGAGCIDAALNNFVALHYKARHMSWLHCFWGIGATSGPVIMAFFIAKSNSWNLGYQTIGILQIVLTAILFLTLPLWKKASSPEENGDPKVKTISLPEILKLPAARPALTAFFCYCGIEMTAGLWGSSFVVAGKGLSPAMGAQFTSLFYLGITAGRFLSGFITMKLNNKNLIRTGCTAIGLGILLLVFSSGVLFMKAGFILIGIGCAPIYPSMLHDTPNRFGPELSQALMGIQMAFAYVGNLVLPPLLGMLSGWIGIGIFPFYLLFFLLLMALSTEWVNRIAEKRNSMQP